MPTGGSKTKGRAKTTNLPDDEEEYLMYNDFTSTEPTSSTTRGKKRAATDDGNSSVSGFGDVEKMIASFGADFTKSIQNKRKKLDMFTQASLQSSSKKMGEMNRKQNSERKKITEGYNKQVSTILSQWEEDMQKAKESEEKFSALMKQHYKQYQQQRIAQTQRFKTMKQLQEDFTKGLEVLEESHEKQLSTIQDELKDEMEALRKKILMESQQQEMSSVRRSLQLLAQVGEE